MPGGGVALLYASKALEAVRETLSNFDQRIGVRIVQSALTVPAKTIADNAGAQRPLCPLVARSIQLLHL